MFERSRNYCHIGNFIVRFIWPKRILANELRMNERMAGKIGYPFHFILCCQQIVVDNEVNLGPTNCRQLARYTRLPVRYEATPNSVAHKDGNLLINTIKVTAAYSPNNAAKFKA